MRRRDILASAVLLSAAAGAVEASAPPAKKEGADPAGQYVDLSPIALPVLDGRRLKNYVFVSLRLKLSPRADMQKWRDKEPYFRDALVRAAHRTALNPPGDFSTLDEARLKSMLMAEAGKITGPGVVTGVALKSPQAPQRRLRSARPAAAAPH